MRKDAARNRDQILTVATELIAADGAAVSMEAIAAGAGVAVGTLYRHHPTKTHLVAAVIEDSVERIAELAAAAVAAVEAGGDPAQELTNLFRRIATRCANNRALRSAAHSLGDPSGVPPEQALAASDSPLGRTFASLDFLLAAARDAGSLRVDVTRRDLSVLFHGVFDFQLEESARDRYVEIIMAGLARPAPCAP
jgi:AcrR family transcriptional regulator